MTYLFPWRLPLVGLIAINLFLTGLLIGPQIRSFNPPDPATIADHIMDELVALLDDSDAALLKAAFAKHRSELLAATAQFRDSRLKVPKLLAADPLDRAQLEAALNEAMSGGRGLEAVAFRLLIDVATSLSPAGRKKVATFMATKTPP